MAKSTQVTMLIFAKTDMGILPCKRYHCIAAGHRHMLPDSAREEPEQYAPYRGSEDSVRPSCGPCVSERVRKVRISQVVSVLEAIVSGHRITVYTGYLFTEELRILLRGPPRRLKQVTLTNQLIVHAADNAYGGHVRSITRHDVTRLTGHGCDELD